MSDLLKELEAAKDICVSKDFPVVAEFLGEAIIELERLQTDNKRLQAELDKANKNTEVDLSMVVSIEMAEKIVRLESELDKVRGDVRQIQAIAELPPIDREILNIANRILETSHD